MLKCKLENPHMTDIGPLMNIVLINEDGSRSDYGAAIVPYHDSNFICYRMHNGIVTQSAIGNSGLFPFRKIMRSSMMAKHKKAVIHGEIALAIIDFIGVISDLMHEDILSPDEVSVRFRSPEMEKYIDLCYTYFKDL